MTRTPFAIEVLDAARRQRLQRGALGVDEHAVAAYEFGDEAAVSVRVVKLTRAAQQQGLVEGALEVAVGALDAAVLVGDAAIVARGAQSRSAGTAP